MDRAPWEVSCAEMSQDPDGVWSAEASTLRFPLGRWPRELLLVGGDGETPTLLTFVRFECNAEGEVQVGIYRNERQGVELHVFND